MARNIPLTQFNLLQYVGYYPAINEIIAIKDYGGDSDICYSVEITRQFNIQDQMDSDWWIDWREEFWTEEM